MPDSVTPPFDLSDLTRLFRTKVTVCDCGCWLWSEKRLDHAGYGQFKFNGRNMPAHRFAYERLVGPIPEGLHLDHLCDRHRNCVNPSHLEPVSPSENAIRANRRRWHGDQ